MVALQFQRAGTGSRGLLVAGDEEVFGHGRGKLGNVFAVIFEDLRRVGTALDRDGKLAVTEDVRLAGPAVLP